MILSTSSKQPKYTEAIPVELWSEIFELALPSFDHLCRNRWDISRSDVPISVSQTCSRWRDIAISFTPRIWTNILVRIVAYDSDPESAGIFPHPYETDLWVARSKHCPLSVCFDADLCDDPVSEETYPLFSGFFLHMPRWKVAVLRISGITDDFLSYLKSLFARSNTPLLESLVSDIQLVYPVNQAFFPADLWSGSPRLRGLTVLTDFSDYDFGITRWTSSSRIPYEQLTYLNIEAAIEVPIIDVIEIIHIFKYAKNLVTCFLEGICDPDPGIPFDETIPPVLSRHLQHLRLCFDLTSRESSFGYIPLPDLLRYLTAPSLTTLTLANEPNWSQGQYRAFILRSDCQLEELCLISTPLTSQDFEDCMNLSLSLKRLHADHFVFGGTGGFAKQMSQWDEDRHQFAICPNLEELSLKLLHDMDWDTMRKMLKMRLSPPDNNLNTFSTFGLEIEPDNGVTLKDLTEFLGLQPLCEEFDLELYVCHTVLRKRWSTIGHSNDEQRVYLSELKV